MRKFYQYILLLLVLALASCEELYTPEIEESPSALVVEGFLTDRNEHITVRLTRSASFNDNSFYYNERGAIVTIESLSGQVYSTSEVSKGNYQTNEPVKTEAGQGYYVRIITRDGTEYRSEVEEMPVPTQIQDVYVVDSTFRDVNYNYWGEPVVSDYRGITFSIRPQQTGVENTGFLYRWNGLVNYLVYSELQLSGFNYYCWDKIWSTTTYVYDYFKDEYIAELPVGDLHSLSFYYLGPLPIDSTRFMGEIQRINTTSLYYQLEQYSISKKGAKYWRSIKKQSESSGTLFDPVEEQIVGNITCLSDSCKIAFGYFSVVSASEKVIAVDFDGEKCEEVRVVDSMPNPDHDEDCSLNVMPDFWFN